MVGEGGGDRRRGGHAAGPEGNGGDQERVQIRVVEARRAQRGGGGGGGLGGGGIVAGVEQDEHKRLPDVVDGAERLPRAPRGEKVFVPAVRAAAVYCAGNATERNEKWS